MKVSKNKLHLTDKIIEDFKNRFYDSQDEIFDLLREFLHTQTMGTGLTEHK